MKKITLLLFIFSFIGTVSFSQTTETFETETTNSTTFTDNGQSFTINDLEPGSGNYDIEEFSGAGWNGSGNDNKFIDNSSGITNGLDGSSFSITTTDGANITVKSFYLFVANSSLNIASTTVTITGKKDGATVYTFSKSSGFANPETFSPNNGYTFIDLATEGGANNAILEVDELIISSTGNGDYLGLDAFRWAAGFTNTAPVIGGTVANQTVNDTATIQPFSAITTTDADGDNLSATITLDNNFKGVLTGTGLSGSGPYSITSTTPSDLQVKLRALSFNPTDNRTSASETTTFEVEINDGTDTNTDTTTTVISNAVSPTVTSVSVPTNATYTTGQNLDFTVNFSENVLVSGSPQISITVGSTTRQATYVSGTSSGSLVFRYTVQNGDNDNDGIAVGNLALNGGTIRDSGTANANLTLNSVGNTGSILVDAVSPAVTSVTVPANGTYVSGQNLDFTVNFSENITVNTGGGSPYINITIGSSSKIANFSSGSGNSYTFRYQIQNGDLDTDGISVGTVTTNGATFRDAANNNANLTLNNVGNTTFVLVDAVAPNITSVSVPANATYLAGQNLDFTVNFNENITVVTTGGTPQVSLTIGATTRQAAYVSGSGSGSLVFRYTLQINELDTDGIVVGTLSANGGTLKDVAGNNANLTLNSVGSTSSVLVDAVAPTITSVGVPANATYLAGQNLDFTVNFNEDITVVTTGGTPQISLTIGSTSYQASYISGSGSSALTFRYTVQNGNNDSDGIAIGSLSLNGGTFKDAAGNDANLTLNSVASTTSVLVDTPLNNALNFDGTNDQVDLGNNLNSTLDNLNTFTAEAMVRPETNSGLGVIVGNWNNGTANMQFLLRRDGASYTFFVDDGTGFDFVTATGAVSVGTWTHVAGVWDGSEIRIYVNGVLSGTTTAINGANFTTTTNPIRIGFNNINENFNGDIDEVRIWSDVRDVTELNALKDTELNGGESNLLGYYNFNKGIPNGNNTGETTLLDLSTNNNNGTLSNFGLSGASSNWVVGTPIETIPVVQSVAVPSNATYTSGQNLDFTVNYSEDVTVSEIGGTPQIAITIGSTVRQAEYLSGSGSSSLVFRYTVDAADLDTDGIIIGTLDANGGTLKDGNGNDINLKLNNVGDTSNVLVGNPTFTWTGTTDNNWNTASNWDLNSVPITTADVLIPTGLTNYPTASSAVSVNSVSIASGATLIATSTFTTTTSATYSRSLTGSRWYYLSSPVIGETYDATWAMANSIATGSTSSSNYGVSTYNANLNDPTTGSWTYLQTDNSNNGTFNDSQGYGIYRSTTGDVSFTGSGIYNSTQSFPLDGPNNYTLIGNPFSAFISIGDLFTDNIALDEVDSDLYFWNGSSYITRSSFADASFEIAPSQGFFAKPMGNGMNFQFNYSRVSHNATDTFQKTANSRPEIHLTVNDGSRDALARVLYIDGTTKGFDAGYDGKLFGGVTYSFAIYSDLIETNGEKYQTQSLPNKEHESMIIPIGVIADAGKEITFTAETLNIPNGLNVYIEDRENNTFKQLNQEEASYKVALSAKLNGTGRFYLHTASKVLSTPSEILNSVSIYKTDNNNLRIAGLHNGEATVKIYTVLGKKVVAKSFLADGPKNIALPNLASGVYLVKLKTKSGKLNKKIIIE